jgi:hypothetical protein
MLAMMSDTKKMLVQMKLRNLELAEQEKANKKVINRIDKQLKNFFKKHLQTG